MHMTSFGACEIRMRRGGGGTHLHAVLKGYLLLGPGIMCAV